MNPPLRSGKIAVVIVVVFAISHATRGFPAQAPGSVLDVLANPHKFWNKTVILTGQVRSVAPNPPGSRRGSFVLRDVNDNDITIITDDLPTQGKQIRVTGIVEQSSPDQTIPMIRQVRNREESKAFVPAKITVEPIEPAAGEIPPGAERTERTTSPAGPEQGVNATAPSPQPSANALNTPTVPASPAPTPPVQPAVAQAAPPQRPGLTPLIYGLAGTAVALLLVLIYLLRTRKAASASMPAEGPALGRAPGNSVAAQVSRRQVLEYDSQPPAPVSKATEVFYEVGAEIEVLEGPDSGKRFRLTKPVITIGRSGERQNDVTLTDATVSRAHARIMYSMHTKTFLLINESATNPIQVNGNPIETRHINEEDSIRLGATLLKLRELGPK
jgi:hypothetical protein